MSDSQSQRRLRALAWEARRRGVSYGVLCTQLGPGEEKEILERYAAAMGIRTGPRRRQSADPKWPFDPTEARVLYDKGYSDMEIGRRLETSKNTVRQWRLESGLPCNNPQRFPADRARALYQLGLRDDVIAARIGRSEGAVRAWRGRENLPVATPKTGGDGGGS